MFEYCRLRHPNGFGFYHFSNYAMKCFYRFGRVYHFEHTDGKSKNAINSYQISSYSLIIYWYFDPHTRTVEFAAGISSEVDLYHTFYCRSQVNSDIVLEIEVCTGS